VTAVATRKSMTGTTARLRLKLEQIVAEYGRLIRSVVRKVCRARPAIDLEDVEQEVRLKLWRVLSSRTEVQHLPSYVYRVAYSVAIDQLRRIDVRSEDQFFSTDDDDGSSTGELERVPADPSVAPDRVAACREAAHAVGEAVDRLPERRRQAVKLYLLGLNHVEIAEATGWTESVARNHVYRGLGDLRDALAERGIEYAPQW
jgi:RNA polymerase sigma factor (sigma-70 family)